MSVHKNENNDGEDMIALDSNNLEDLPGGWREAFKRTAELSGWQIFTGKTFL